MRIRITIDGFGADGTHYLTKPGQPFEITFSDHDAAAAMVMVEALKASPLVKALEWEDPQPAKVETYKREEQ